MLLRIALYLEMPGEGRVELVALLSQVLKQLLSGMQKEYHAKNWNYKNVSIHTASM